MERYEELKVLLENEPLWVEGVTQDGETVLVERGTWLEDEETFSIKETIFQKNGWLCIHYYYPDGTIEELFER